MQLKPSVMLMTACGLSCCAGASEATVTAYSNQSSFLAALSSFEVDTFDNLGGIPASPLHRSTASYGYTATTGPNYPYYLGTGPGSNHWLAAGDLRDTVTFASLTGGPQAIGGNFFDSLTTNNTVPTASVGDVTVTVTDSLGAQSTQTVSGATPATFLGFVSTGTIVSLSVLDPQHAHFVSVDNLTFAAVVPEPASTALLLSGLGIVGIAARRRQGRVGR